MSSQIQVIEMPLDDGDSFLVEVARPVTDELVPAARPGAFVGRAGATLDAALDELRPVLGTLAGWARSAGPDTAEVEFGLKLTAGSSVVVSSGSAEVNFTVRLTWSAGDR
ncbi:CU044_2847 family protein [Promicromonospora sp. NPDC019610]|uniref:CU044_2847 family protein n=1 Tax=Promicromonospora sp. NPDC019610 TaxID=3364405 RepID=UPI0037AC60A1